MDREQSGPETSRGTTHVTMKRQLSVKQLSGIWSLLSFGAEVGILIFCRDEDV